jgi:HMG (high mobility group) box
MTSPMQRYKLTETGLDENSALTSQTLNPDGTPKRPMNAFMIFARRRRPQVSAANQSMRTGEISKILSKEWNAMQSASKKSDIVLLLANVNMFADGETILSGSSQAA